MNHPSSCTIKIVKEYFDKGTLPEVGTKCEPDMTAYEYFESLEAKTGNSTATKRGLYGKKRSGLGMFGHQI